MVGGGTWVDKTTFFWEFEHEHRVLHEVKLKKKDISGGFIKVHWATCSWSLLKNFLILDKKNPPPGKGEGERCSSSSPFKKCAGQRLGLPITVKLTCSLRVGASVKSTLQRYWPASAPRTPSTLRVAGYVSGLKRARGPSHFSSDQIICEAEGEVTVWPAPTSRLQRKQRKYLFNKSPIHHLDI